MTQKDNASSQPPHFNVGDQVISPRFGIGKIVSIEYMESVGEDIFMVEGQKDQSKLFIPVSLSAQLRLIVNKDEMDRTLENMEKVQIEEKVFDSRRERVEYFKDLQKTVPLKDLSEAVVEMYETPSKGKVELQILDNMIEILAVEVAELNSIDQEEAFKQVQDILNKR